MPVAPNRLRGASLPGGGRRAASVRAAGGRRGRGGRRRRWQPAGTHAAPRPARPAALPPRAVTARCPLTSGGECGDPHHREAPSAGPRGAWARRGPFPPGTQKRTPARCMPWQAPGDPGAGRLPHTKRAGLAGGPASAASHLPGKATLPLPPRSPLPGLPPPQPVLTPPHLANPQPPPHKLGNRLAPASRWEYTSHHPHAPL